MLQRVASRGRGAGRSCSRLAAGTTLVLASLVTKSTFAGNLDSYYLSGDAALQGGAITADSRGGAAAWYNPAGLAELPGLRLDVSVNAFAIRFGGHPNLESAASEAKVTSLNVIDFNVVPTSLTLSRRFGKLGLGVGVFVPVQSSTFLRTQVESSATASALGTSAALDIYERSQQYAAGASFGLALSPVVDFGASLFVNYRTELDIAGVEFSTLAADSAGSGTSLHETFDRQQVGVQPVLGVQLHPRGYNVGLTLRFPALQLYDVTQSVDIVSSGDGPPQSSFDDRAGVSKAVVSPLRFHAAISRDLGASRLALEASYQSPLRNEDIDWQPTLNARLGGLHRLSPRLAIGGGIHTDRSPIRHLSGFGDSRIDYYGVTFALDWGTHFDVVAREAEPLPAHSQFRFGSTFAVTYALGLGEVVNGRFGIDSTGQARLDQPRQSVAVHELIFSVCSSLTE